MLFLERFLALFIALGLFYPLAGSDWDLVSIDDEQVSIATENTEFIDSDPFRFIDFIATLSLYEILFYTVIFILPSVMTLLDKKIKRWHIIYFTVKFINVLGLFSLIGLTVFIIGQPLLMGYLLFFSIVIYGVLMFKEALKRLFLMVDRK